MEGQIIEVLHVGLLIKAAVKLSKVLFVSTQ